MEMKSIKRDMQLAFQYNKHEAVVVTQHIIRRIQKLKTLSSYLPLNDLLLLWFSFASLSQQDQPNAILKQWSQLCKER